MTATRGPTFVYDPFSIEAMRDPLPLYRELRVHHPVYRLEQYDAWALARFADVWDVIQDRERFTIVEGPIFEPARIRTHLHGPPSPPTQHPLPSFSTVDPPLNTALRQGLGGHLRPRAVAALEAGMRALARARLDALVPAGRFDVTVDYAGPVSAAMMCRVVGLPVEHAAQVLDLVNRGMRRRPPGISPEGTAARGELHAMLVALVQQRRAHPGHGDARAIADDLLDARVDGRRLDDAEVATQLGTVVSGGTETVPKVVAGGLLELWRHPDQRAAIGCDAVRCATAFEEMMRYGAPLQWVGRTVLHDCVVAGTPMRAGQRVFLLLASANRDPREFDDPDDFRWDRPINRHLAFGQGVHFCIGTHLARLEGRVLLEELLRRIPAYAIDERGLQRPPSDFQVGYTALPLVVT